MPDPYSFLKDNKWPLFLLNHMDPLKKAEYDDKPRSLNKSILYLFNDHKSSYGKYKPSATNTRYTHINVLNIEKIFPYMHLRPFHSIYITPGVIYREKEN